MRLRPRLGLVLPVALVVTATVLVSSSLAARSAKPLQGKTVGLNFCTAQNPWCQSWINEFQKYLRARGAKVTVLTSPFDPATDAKNMNTLIAQKPNLIVNEADDPTSVVASLLRAKAAGIPTVNVTGRLTAAGQKLVTSSVQTDNRALGRYAAANLVQGMRKAGYKSGNVIALTGTASQLIVQDRVASFKKAMKKYPQYKIVAIKDTNWDQATSAKVAQQLFAQYASKGGIQGAYGMADNQAVGIIQGAQQAGVKVGLKNKGLIVTGSNCLGVGVKAIEAGTQYGTATQAPYQEALSAARVVTKILEGKKVPKVVWNKEYRITKANVKKYAKLCTY